MRLDAASPAADYFGDLWVDVLGHVDQQGDDIVTLDSAAR